MSKEAMKLEAVYETIIQWDEGGGKRSRRELARRIVALAEQPAQQPPKMFDLTSPPAPWQCRILITHPKSEPEHWPNELRLKYMEAELAEYRASFNPQPAPAQRKPLTDEEILAVARDHYNLYQRPEISFARAIEAAHGIKENA